MKKLIYVFLLISYGLDAQQCTSDIEITQANYNVSHTKSDTYIKISSSVVNNSSVTLNAHVDDGYIELNPGFISDPLSSGEFIAKLTYDCDSSNANRSLENGNSEIKEEYLLDIYPNPNDGSFFVTGVKDKSTLKIFSFEGKLLKTQIINNQSNIIIDLPSGMYLASIEMDGKITTKKIIIN